MRHAVLFDFDFTLADASRAVVGCVNHALTEMGYEAADPLSIRRTIGLPLPTTLFRLIGIPEEDEHSGTLGQRFTRLFLTRADEIMAEQTELIPTTREIVGRLRSRGLELGVVSTKYRYRIEEILDRQRFREPFGVIVGGEEVTHHKPDPEGLNLALDRLDLTANRVLYVGDHTVDAEAAERAGIPFVAVLTGTTSRESFDRFPTRAILSDLTGLPAVLDVEMPPGP